MLAEARRRLDRVTPEQAAEAAAHGDAVIVDIRADSQIEQDGGVPEAKRIPRNVLEWRLDPACEHRDPELASYDRRVILMCDEGYQSSLAAATLKDLGIEHATDMIGGFQAWRDAGLPRREPPP